MEGAWLRHRQLETSTKLGYRPPKGGRTSESDHFVRDIFRYDRASSYNRPSSDGHSTKDRRIDAYVGLRFDGDRTDLDRESGHVIEGGIMQKDERTRRDDDAVLDGEQRSKALVNSSIEADEDIFADLGPQLAPPCNFVFFHQS